MAVLLARKNIKDFLIFLPILAVFVLCQLPSFGLPVIHSLPWFSFARFSARFAVLYPVLLSFLVLGMGRVDWRRLPARLALAAMAPIALLELHTAYTHGPPHSTDNVDAGFFDSMKTVREQEGEAVLDWPFCIAGGNGFGGNFLGRYYKRQSTIFAFRQFHEKKVVGQYYGRLHPDQINAFLLAGWDRLFFPDDPNPHRATRQARDFSEDEWAFFKRFFQLHDFARVNLYVDLLPPAPVERFYRDIARPLARTDFPGDVWRDLVDRERGLELQF